MITRSILAFACAAAAGVVLAPPASAAAASAVTTRAELTAALAATPGGTRLDSHRASWQGGAVILDVAPASVGSCASGSFCAYSGKNLGGSSVSYSSCSTYTPTITVASIANARTSGAVQGINNAGAILATVAAGGRLNSAPAGVVKLRCVP